MSSSFHFRFVIVVLLATLFFPYFCTRGICGNVITRIPGFTGPLPFYFETGYVGVDESNDIQLFYYFIESEGDPGQDPLILWLTGGPGCSSVSGLFFEIGPLKFETVDYDGSLPRLVYFSESWTKVSSIIFLDFPAGAGFSFSNKPEGDEVSDKSSSKQVAEFLRKWLTDHPQYLGSHLYVAGDSYGGKVVPVVAQEILHGIEAGQKPVPNFKGYALGNPITDEENDFNARIPYAHNMGILSDELYQMTIANCKAEDIRLPRSAICTQFSERVDMFFAELNMAQILEPYCPVIASKHQELRYRRSLEDKSSQIAVAPPAPPLECRSYAYYLSYYWANHKAVRQAIGIQEGTVEEWVRCNKKFNYTEDVKSSVAYQKSILSKGFRALVYSGDHDLIVPFIGTMEWIKSLNSSVVDEWRSWHVSGQVAGYTIAYANNLTFATVKGAGHTAPEYKPKQCLAMIRRWLSNKPL